MRDVRRAADFHLGNRRPESPTDNRHWGRARVGAGLQPQWAAPGGRRGASVSNVISLYDIESGRVVRRLFGHESHVSGIAFSPDGRYVSSGDDTGEVRLWDLEVEPAFKIRFDEKDHITGAQNQEFHFGPEDRWLAVSGGARSVLCDPSDKGILATHKDVGGAMAFRQSRLAGALHQIEQVSLMLVQFLLTLKT